MSRVSRWLVVAGLSCVASPDQPVGSAGQDPLRAGPPVVLEISSGATRTFALNLAAGEFARLTVDGHGTLLHLSIATPEGATLADRERRGGVRDPIVWVYVADRSVQLMATIASRESSGPPRRMSVTVDQRPGSPPDVHRAAAAQAVERAERFERSGGAEAQPALAQYEEALERFRAAGDAGDEGRTLIHIGRLLAESGRSREAAQSFEQAIARCRAAGDLACEGAGLHRLGRLLAATGQPEKGRRAGHLPGLSTWMRSSD